MPASILILPPREDKNISGKLTDVEQAVYSAYEDAPIMIEVAKCESRMKQFTKSGKILRGELVPSDIGVMQINEMYHIDTAKRLGFNIHTLEGNIGYGRYLYEKYGTKPWNASKACWGKYREVAEIDKKVRS